MDAFGDELTFRIGVLNVSVEDRRPFTWGRLGRVHLGTEVLGEVEVVAGFDAEERDAFVVGAFDRVGCSRGWRGDVEGERCATREVGYFEGIVIVLVIFDGEGVDIVRKIRDGLAVELGFGREDKARLQRQHLREEAHALVTLLMVEEGGDRCVDGITLLGCGAGGDGNRRDAVFPEFAGGNLRAGANALERPWKLAVTPARFASIGNRQLVTIEREGDSVSIVACRGGIVRQILRDPVKFATGEDGRGAFALGLGARG